MRGFVLDGEVAVVEVFVAAGAQGDEVVRLGLAAVGVVDDVVDFQPEGVGAAGDGAAVAVASQDFAALGLWWGLERRG